MNNNRGPTDRQKKSPSAVFDGTYDTRGLSNEVNTSLQNHTTSDFVSQVTSKTHENRFQAFFPSDRFRRWYNQKYFNVYQSEAIEDDSDVASVNSLGKAPDAPGQVESVAKPSDPPSGVDGNDVTILINEHKSCTPLTARVYENYLDSGKSGADNRLVERISRYEKAKKRSAQLVDFLRSQPDNDAMSHRAGKLSYCGSILMFRDYLEYGESRLQGGVFCGQPKLCMGCAIRRSSRLLRDLVTKESQILYEANFDDSSVQYGDREPLLPYLVTFTVKNGADLFERYSHLDRSIKFLSDRARNIRSRGSRYQFHTEWSKSEGTFLSYEFKRGQNSNMWHPHCHCVWNCRKKPNVYKLREEWHKVTGDSFIVDVRPFDCNDAFYSMARRGCFDFRFAQDTLAGDLVEVSKYCLKLTDMPESDVWSAFLGLFGKRMARTYGKLYGVKISDNMKDLYESNLDGKYVDYVLGWNNSSEEYDCKESRFGVES